MASWGIARRMADSCASSVAGGVTAVRTCRAKILSPAIAYARFPAFQRLTLFPSSYSPSHSSAFPFSTLCASVSETNVGFRRPEEIFWQKGLANNVCLIGNINRNVDIKYLDSGKIVTSTSMKVKRFTPGYGEADSVFILQFWDELAEVAAAHLKLEDRVYVSGSIWVDNYVDKDNIQRSICKVIAKDLKFVGTDYRDAKYGTSGTEDQPTQVLSMDDQWKDYFQNPSDYWDNRVGKTNPRAPDFKHKTTGVALWVENRRNPSWVIERLEQQGPVVEGTFGSLAKGERLKEAEKLWQAFFANPMDWWDNRDSKSAGSFFPEKSTTLGSLIGLQSGSHRDQSHAALAPGPGAMEFVERRKSTMASSSSLRNRTAWCSMFGCGMGSNREALGMSPSLAHLLEEERRAAGSQRQVSTWNNFVGEQITEYDRDQGCRTPSVRVQNNTLFDAEGILPPHPSGAPLKLILQHPSPSSSYVSVDWNVFNGRHPHYHRGGGGEGPSYAKLFTFWPNLCGRLLGNRLTI